MFQNISADRLETLLDQGRAFTLADVREPEEYREGHLAGAVNLPVQQILKITEQSGFFEDPEKFFLPLHYLIQKQIRFSLHFPSKSLSYLSLV